MERVIVLNGDYTFLNIVSWKRAVALILKGKTEVLKYSERSIHLMDGSEFKLPLVMRLIKIIRMVYRNRVPFSKKNIMIRDGYKCGYCGTNRELTIDHIIPSSRGGKNTWENCVTACRDCNNKKGRRTPNEAKMYLQTKTYAPTIMEFFRIKMKNLGIDIVLKDLGVY